MVELTGSTILIVDDDPMFRLMLHQFLEGHQLQVCEACDGREALDVFEQESPDMVLMDADMPVMNGFDACKHICESDHEKVSPVLMITSMDDEAFISTAFAAGVVDYITKPINWTVLEQRIRHQLKASQAVRALKASEERFRLLFHKAPLAYVSLDVNGYIIETNPAWLNMLDYEKNQVLDRPIDQFIHPDDQNKYREMFLLYKQQGYIQCHFRMLNSKQEVIEVELNGRIGHGLEGQFKQSHCILQDITQRNAMEKELKRLATTDPLTGLANRRAFFETAERVRLHSIRYQHPMAAMMVDIDLFKSFNDTFGHDIGDEVLILVADMMRQSLREVDVLGRLGGEEFAVVLPETDMQKAIQIAERMRISIEKSKLNIVNEQYVNTTVSIGVTQLMDEESMEQLLKKADNLLYQAKEHGRNRVEK